MQPPGPHNGKFPDKLSLTMIIIIIIIAIQLTVLMIPTNDGCCYCGGKKKYLQINSLIKLISWLDHPFTSNFCNKRKICPGGTMMQQQIANAITLYLP